jgi:Ca2+-binding RTX toxin-like protein
VVNGGSLDASGWSFLQWSVADTITVNGSDGADVIVGSTAVDTIDGGAGDDTITGGGLLADKLNGGLGNDTYEVATGNATIVDIGGTSDTIRSFVYRDLGDFSGV